MRGIKKLPLSKAEKLRRASKITWIISAWMTGIFIYAVLSTQLSNPFYLYGITIAISLSVQYIMTLIESSLFSGELTPLWQLDWSVNNGSLPWLYAGAILCLLLDVLFNLGGVYLFMSQLSSSNIGQSALGMSTSFVHIIEKVMTVALAVLFAVGSELLDEFASYVETGQGRSKSQQHQTQNNVRSFPIENVIENVGKPENKPMSEDELQIKRLLNQQEER